MNSRLANVISYVFHPGMMPTYLLTTLYFICPFIVSMDGYSNYSKLLLLIFVFAYTFLFPLVLIFWLFKRGAIKSIKLERLSDRKVPYFFTLVCYLFLAYFFYSRAAFLMPSAIIIAYTAAVVGVIALISFWWQVSAHAAGIAGVLGTLFMLKIRFDSSELSLPFFLALLIAGLIISSRLKLNAHTPLQTFFGFTIGLLLSIFGSLLI